MATIDNTPGETGAPDIWAITAEDILNAEIVSDKVVALTPAERGSEYALDARLKDAQLFAQKLFGDISEDYKISLAWLRRVSGGVDIAYEVVEPKDMRAAVKKLVQQDVMAMNLGCYVRVTPLNSFFKGAGRGVEKDSAGTKVLWADLDTYKTPYAREIVLQKLTTNQTNVPAPTLIVDSGNGLQVYWMLDRFITDLSAIKERCRGIVQTLKQFGADNTFNPAQLLRIPGTCNRKDPLNPKHVRILWYNRGNVYKLEQFPNDAEIEATFVETIDLPKDFLECLQRESPETHNRIVAEESAKVAGAVTTANGRVDRSSNDMWVAVKLFGLNVVGGTRITSGILQALFQTSGLFIHSKTAEKGSDYALRTILGAESYVSKIRLKDPQRFFSGRSFIPMLLGEELLYENHVLSASTQMWLYDSGVFKNRAVDILQQTIVQKLGIKWQRAHAANTVEWIRAKTQKDLANDVLPFANVMNGMLHITPTAVELLPHSPSYCSLAQMPVEYMEPENLKNELEVVDAFVREILTTDTAISQFFQFAGTVLLPDYRFKKVLLLIGPTDCGKSTLLTLFGDIVGNENIASRTFQDLAGGNRFARASLIGKLVNVYADLPALEAKDVGPFKALTGNDVVDAEFKGVDAVSFRNYAKLIFSTNTFPRVRLVDQAFFNRWLIIPCTTRFVQDMETKKRLQQYEPDTDVLLMDREKAYKMQDPKIRSAFLWRAIEGLQDLLRNKQFTESTESQLMQGEFMAYADPVAGFMLSCTTADHSARVLKNDLYNAFLAWCNYYTVEKMSMRAFNKRLADLRVNLGFFEAVNSQVTVNNVTRVGNVIIGRSLKTHIKSATGVIVRLNSIVGIQGDWEAKNT